MRRSQSFRFSNPLVYLALAAAPAVLQVGCGPEFESCEAKRDCPSKTQGGGGNGGSSQGGATSGTTSTGGSSSSGGSSHAGSGAITGAEGGATTGGAGGAGASNGLGGEAGDSDGGGDAGAHATGGSDNAGGTGAATGGANVAGSAGGFTGGSKATGGAAGTGGSTGGVASTGGAKATGGTATGGSKATGGAASSGGSKASGGAAGSGGTGGTPGATCGDGVVGNQEECDDANQDAADGCRTDCKWGPQQVVVGGRSSCAIFGNGSAKCWGENQYGQLGQGDVADRGDSAGELGAALGAIRIGNSAATFTALAIGNSTCGVVAGQLWCWGSNTQGQVGAGLSDGAPVLVPYRVDLGESVRSVVVGETHACALLASGHVKCWGEAKMVGNGRPELGNLGDEPREVGPSLPPVSLPELATALSAGSYHTCALLTSGTVACWGENTAGKLGLGTTSGFDYGRVSPDSLPTVYLGPGAAVTRIGLGMDHTCAVLSAPSAAVKCWGRGTFGALGYGDEESRGGVPQELGASTLIVPITTSADPVNSVYGSKDATCALLKSGAVKCWGIASNPVLAQPDLVASAGNIGDAPNEVGQLAAINLGSGVRARSLGIGDLHACALLDTGEVKCWGNNSNGQLGIGNTDTIGDAKSELGAALKAVPLQ